jgi:hypothetical protein
MMLRKAFDQRNHNMREKQAREAQQLAKGAQLPLRWDLLLPATRAGICAGALHSLQAEVVGSASTQVVSLVSELAQAVWASGERAKRDPTRGFGEWPELIPTLQGMLAPTAKQPHQSTALKAVGLLAAFVGEDALAPYAAPLGGALQALLTGGEQKVRVESLMACGAMVKAIDADPEDEGKKARNVAILRSFSSLVPAMLAALQGAFGASEELAQRALETFTEMVVAQNNFFRDHLEPVASAMLTILAAPAAAGLASETREAALEFLVTLAECAGSKVRSVPALSAHIIDKALVNMATLEETPAWAGRDYTGDEEEAEEEELAKTSTDALGRLASAIGGKQAWELLAPRLTPLLQSAAWQQRVAGLEGIAALAGGCAQYMALSKMVRKLVEVMLPCLGDAHPRVRASAVRNLEVLIECFSDPAAHQDGLDEQQAELAGGMIKGKGGQDAAGAASRARKAAAKEIRGIADVAGDILLPALIAAAGRGMTPLRVRGQAVSAIVSFLRTDGDTAVDSRLMTANEGELMSALSSCMADFPQTFYSSRYSTVSALGLCAHELSGGDDGFLRYYQPVVTALTPVMSEAVPADATVQQTVDAAGLRAAAMLSAADCMENVKKDVSGVHAAQLLSSVLVAMRTGFGHDDEDSFPQMCGVITKVANLLEVDFAPFLAPTITLLLEKAKRVVGATEVSKAMLSAVQDEDEIKRVIAEDNHALSEKQESIDTINAVIAACSAPLVDSIDGLLQEIAPSLSDKFPQVKINTAQLMSTLVFVAAGDKRGDNGHGTRMISAVFSAIVLQLDKEPVGSLARVGLLEVLENLAEESANSHKPSFIGPPLSPEGDTDGYVPYPMPIAALPTLFKEIQVTMQALTEQRERSAKQLLENPDTDEVDLEELQKKLEGESEIQDTLVNLVVSGMGLRPAHARAAPSPLPHAPPPPPTHPLPPASPLPFTVGLLHQGAQARGVASAHRPGDG